MDSYEDMVNLANLLGLQVTEKYFKSSAKGLCKGNKIGISKNIDCQAEKRCVLAEEIAHSVYTVGDILDQGDEQAAKQEYFARTRSYELLMPFENLIRAYLKHEHEPYEIAAELNVTEEVLREALSYFASKYGNFKYGKFFITFEPLVVREDSLHTD